jgi:hypothetical protein
MIPVSGVALVGLLLAITVETQGRRSNDATLIRRGFGADATAHRSPRWLRLKEELRGS